MVTDWVLVRRLGHELERALAGARVAGSGRLADGRTALALHRRGGPAILAVAPFASPPLVTVESDEFALTAEAGFVRAAEGLRGMTLAKVRARLGDRLLRLTFSARSRFGVGDEVELYLELVPRFGNLVLVKRDRVVAAAKEFTPAQNERRSVMAGQPYGLPPLATGSPSPPRLVAESGTDPDAFLAYAQSDEMLTVPLYVYRRGGVLLQAHVVPLSGFADAICTREPSLLAILEELYSQGADRGENERATRRRRLALKKLAEREAKLRAELASLAAKRRRADERDALRSEGEAIFAELHELPEVQRDDAKDRAAKLFTLYKKLGAALPHVERRERQLRAALGAVEMLQWEAQRVSPEELDDLEAALTQLEGRPGPAPRSAPSRRRKRAALEFRTPSGSRIVVGRSPIENAELTFKVARPNDWWFHARGIPGAHVILARDDRAEPPPGDVQAAAALAAYYSKAKAGANVAVDYALRKHVRKQRDGAPGLVWYTNAKTVTAEPRATLGDAVPEVPLAPAGKN